MISSSSIFVLLLIICLFSDGTLAGKRGILSAKEDQLLETELKTLNKPSLKTIMKDGRIYDCVDIYKQPALDHPLLKNHRVQVRPSSALERNITAAWKPIRIELENGCPQGTVIIPRTTKEELERAKSLFKQYQLNSSLERAGLGYDFTGIEMNVKPNTKYHGAEADIDIYQPKVQEHQFSATLVKLRSGFPGFNSYIQAGWMVNPTLYGNGSTRFYVLWSDVHGENLSGCFNIYCPGFIVTTPNIPVDYLFTDVSKADGHQFQVKINIDQDPISGGNWWLRVYDEDKNTRTVVGYWPKELFKSLNNEGAETAAWGGEVYSSTTSSPPMGSGTFDPGEFVETCFMRRVTHRINKDVVFTSPNPADVKIKESRCYYAVSYDNKKTDDYWGYRFSFGGEGGGNGKCKK